MDQAERLNPFEPAIMAAIEGSRAGLWTALPGIIDSFDSGAMTCEVQPAIEGLGEMPDGTTTPRVMPLCLDCPVVFPAGGGVTMTFPLAAGDECLIVFAAKCIDAWWQQGGVQPQAELRMHDLSDGFVIPGPRSQPRVLADVSTSAVEIRSDDGATKIALDPEAQTVDIKAPGGASIEADVTITGTLHVSGNITSDADVIASGKSLTTHTHPGVQSGGSNTGAPN